MKYFVTVILFSLATIIAAPSHAETIDDLVLRGGLYYKKFTDEPFTGKVTGREQGQLKSGKKVDLWKIYYEEGQLKFKKTFKDNKLEGSFQKYNTDGFLISKGYFSDDIKTGHWEEYYASGILFSKGEYVKGKKGGYWEEFYRDGTLKNAGNYLANKRNGEWLFNSEDISWKLNLPYAKSIKGTFKNDLKEDEWVGFNDTAHTRLKFIVYFKNGSREGPWEEYYTDGTVKYGGFYKNNLKHGLWVSEVWPGIHSLGLYKEGEKFGPWSEWAGIRIKSAYNSEGWSWDRYAKDLKGKGKGKSVSSGEYVNGCKDGDWQEYPGWQGKYENCKKNGPWIQFHDGHKAVFIYPEQKGPIAPSVSVIFFHDQNENIITSTGKCRLIELVGLRKIGGWEGYYPNGEYRYKKYYKSRDSSFESETFFNEDGEEITEQTFLGNKWRSDKYSMSSAGYIIYDHNGDCVSD